MRKFLRGGRTRRFLQLASVMGVLTGAWVLLGERDRFVAFIRSWHGALVDLAADDTLLAGTAYTLSVAVAKLTPVTGGGLIMVLGGYLFGTTTGGLLAAVGAAVSALAVALVGRVWLTELVMDRWGERFARIERRLLEDGFNYYLALRLLPVVPAWVANLVPVVVPLPLWQIVIATFFGVLPISFVAARLGSGIARVTADEEALTASLLLDPDVLVPLLVLSLLALLPTALRRLRGRGGS